MKGVTAILKVTLELVKTFTTPGTSNQKRQEIRNQALRAQSARLKRNGAKRRLAHNKLLLGNYYCRDCGKLEFDQERTGGFKPGPKKLRCDDCQALKSLPPI